MHDVYITFRQTTIASYISISVQKWLGANGLNCHTGFDRLRKGDFPEELVQTIDRCNDVIVIITSDTWGRADDETCWMTKEIQTALLLNKNIIPLIMLGEDWPASIPESLSHLRHLNAVIFDPQHIDATIEKLKFTLTASPNQYKVLPYNGNKKFIFISYSHKDSSQVLSIISKMINQGYRVWYDEGIVPGTEWDKNIAEHIINCDYFIAFMSDNYLNSSNCKDELNYARDLEKNRFLVYLEKVNLPPEMQMRLSRIQNIHKYAYEDENMFFEKFFKADKLIECKET